MPSDPRVAAVASAALADLAAPLERFRSAALAAAVEVRALLATLDTGADARLERLRAELGPFAAGRIDPARFGALLSGGPGADPATRGHVEAALETLRTVAARIEEIVAVEVPPGGDLRRAAVDALAGAGRAFGAALAVQHARGGWYRSAEHDALLLAFPFAEWNRAERRLAPPLVIQVDGADLRAAALADLLDGAVKIVLLVRGPCAPAPLVRLVTPGTFVMQTGDVADLARVAACDGPAVAALVPEGAACFVHDPAAAAAARLTVSHLPADPPRRALGGLSAWQQAEELAQLAALGGCPLGPRHSAGEEHPGAVGGPLIHQGPSASRPGGPGPLMNQGPTTAPGPSPTGPEGTPRAPSADVDRLAAWLLRQAGGPA